MWGQAQGDGVDQQTKVFQHDFHLIFVFTFFSASGLINAKSRVAQCSINFQTVVCIVQLTLILHTALIRSDVKDRCLF